MANMDEKVQLCETLIGHQFIDRLRCCEALQTSGLVLVWDGHIRNINKNTRLAVYGDSVLSTALCTQWFSKNLDNAAWTTIRNEVAGNGNLSQVGSQLGLGACINLNPGTIAVSARAMATAVEAILGAVHQDGGDAALARVMADIGLTHEFLAPS